MADSNIQTTLDNISERLESLATRDDVLQLKNEMKSFIEGVKEQLEKMEGRLLDIEAKADRREKEMKKIEKSNEELKTRIRQQDNRLREAEKDRNEMQQYSRRWNIRLYKVKEKSGEKAEECLAKACKIFTEDVGVPITPNDIEVAHRTGQQDQGGKWARPILVRFFDRKKRDTVLSNRRRLKGKHITIDEDLTQANYRLSKAAKDHNAAMASWSTNGKILAKLKNNRVVKLNIHMDLDEVFRRVMNNRMSEDETTR